MVQAVWSTSQGRLLEVTDAATGEQITRLAVHVDPILILFVPLWVLYPSPEALIIAQAAALSIGVYPVVRLALKYTGSAAAAALLAGWYLVFPWIIWNAVNDFHGADAVGPPPAVRHLVPRRAQTCLVLGGRVLALACGELLGLTVAGLGIWYAIHHRRVRVGVAIAAIGAGWTTLCLTVVIPAFNNGDSSRFYSRFETVGGSPSGLLATLVTDPGTIVEALSSGTNLRYALLVVLPTALLAFGSIGLAAVALPQLMVNSLSDFWSTTQPMFQYTMPAIAPLVGATVIGVGRFPPRFRVWASATPLLAAGMILWSAPPIPGGQQFVFGERENRARTMAMQAALAQIPPGVPVVTTNRLGAHLSDRRRVFLFPVRSRAEWAILDVRDPWLQVAGERTDADLFARLLAEFERDPEWRPVFEMEEIRVYRHL